MAEADPDGHLDPRDPGAAEPRAASQAETVGLGLWHGLRKGPPPPAEPHPEPSQTSRHPAAIGEWMARTGLRGWSTLAGRVGPGWTLLETHAVGWKLSALGRRGDLVETIAARARHAATGACAVAFLERKVDPTSPLEVTVAEHKWKFSHGIAWVQCTDEASATFRQGVPHPADGRITPIGARLFSAAVQGEPPLVTIDGGQQWPRVHETTDTEEK